MKMTDRLVETIQFKVISIFGSSETYKTVTIDDTDDLYPFAHFLNHSVLYNKRCYGAFNLGIFTEILKTRTQPIIHKNSDMSDHNNEQGHSNTRAIVNCHLEDQGILTKIMMESNLSDQNYVLEVYENEDDERAVLTVRK